MTIAAIVTIVAVGGIGFAAFTATVNVNGTASTGTASLAWDSSCAGCTFNEYAHGPDWNLIDCGAPAYTGSSFTGLATTMTVDPSNFVPGDSCTYTQSVYNDGTVNVHLGWTNPSITDSIAGCPTSYWFIHSGVTAHDLAPGDSATYGVIIGLAWNAPGACMGQQVSFSDSLSGWAI